MKTGVLDFFKMILSFMILPILRGKWGQGANLDRMPLLPSAQPSQSSLRTAKHPGVLSCVLLACGAM